jgi:hypothetical protein
VSVVDSVSEYDFVVIVRINLTRRYKRSRQKFRDVLGYADKQASSLIEHDDAVKVLSTVGCAELFETSTDMIYITPLPVTELLWLTRYLSPNTGDADKYCGHISGCIEATFR